MRSRAAEFMVPLFVGVPMAAVSTAMVVVSTSGVRTVGLLIGITLAHLAWFGLRSLPLPAFGLVCAAFATQAAASGLFMTVPSAVVFPVALYELCATGRRAAVALALAAGLIGSGVAAWRLGADDSVQAAGLEPSPVLAAIALIAIVAAAVSLGLFRRAQRTNLALLAERVRRAETDRDANRARAIVEERQRIAREMHDVVSHSLSVIVNQARGGRYMTADTERTTGVLLNIEETGRQALTDMRGLVGVLRPESDEPSDGRHSPQPGLSELPGLLDRTRTAGIAVELSHAGHPRVLSPAAELTAFRLTQEALTNVVKHAPDASAVTVVLDWGPRSLTVRINNAGAVHPPSAASGFGLIGMRERLLAVGGSVEAAPDPGGGFTVVAEIPYPAAPAEMEGP